MKKIIAIAVTVLVVGNVIAGSVICHKAKKYVADYMEKNPCIVTCTVVNTGILENGRQYVVFEEPDGTRRSFYESNGCYSVGDVIEIDVAQKPNNTLTSVAEAYECIGTISVMLIIVSVLFVLFFA